MKHFFSGIVFFYLTISPFQIKAQIDYPVSKSEIPLIPADSNRLVFIDSVTFSLEGYEPLQQLLFLKQYCTALQLYNAAGVRAVGFMQSSVMHSHTSSCVVCSPQRGWAGCAAGLVA